MRGGPDTFRLLFAIQITKNMKTSSILTVVTILTVAARVATAGNITGTVTLKGTPPAEQPITQIKDDATCGKLHTTVPTPRHWVAGSKGELANVVVMLKGISGKSTGASAAPAVLGQKGCEDLPPIQAIQTGQKLLVKNSDPVMHNVHSTPVNTGPGKNNEDNKAQMAGSPDLTFTFPAAENFLRFKCDVHQWMYAWVTVVDHPYFAVSDKDGTFKIKDVPPGKYTIEATHRKAGSVTKEVEVKDGAVNLDFEFEVK